MSAVGSVWFQLSFDFREYTQTSLSLVSETRCFNYLLISGAQPLFGQ
ncbi:MAG: hypothetical protein ACP5H5_08010 [Pyrobaculum sp.]